MACRLREPTLQAVRTVANVPHRKNLHAVVQPGCTTKRRATKPGLKSLARGMYPPAVLKKNTRPRLGLDEVKNQAEPGSAKQEDGACEGRCASLGLGPRRYKKCLPGRRRLRSRTSRR